MLGQKLECAASTIEFIKITDDDRSILKVTGTGDESLCFMYDPKTKCLSWLSPKKLTAQKVRMQKLQVKTILIADCKW
jgi:hypothetical protein